MIAKADITGLILAGGAGRRAGGLDKGLITWQGKPLVAHVRDRFAPQVKELIISCNRNDEAYTRYADITFGDARSQFQGPLAGLEAAAQHVNTDFLAITACDLPELPLDLVERLLEPFGGTRNTPEVSYAHDGERAHYLCAVIRRDCLPSLTRFLDGGQRAVRDWYSTRQHSVVDFSETPSSFNNYNLLT